MVKKLFSILKSAGIAVYLPAKKAGSCTSPYAVVDTGRFTPSETGKGVRCSFTVSLFAPLDAFGELDVIQKTVLDAVKGTPFRFDGCDTEDAGGEMDSYKRVLAFRALKKL